MSFTNTKESGLETLIVKWLVEHNGYEEGSNADYNKEYAIDEMGILALHTRIDEMQTSDHIVTVADVRELVDDAIYHATRFSPKHVLDIILGKRYDEDDMIILKERDFNI